MATGAYSRIVHIAHNLFKRSRNICRYLRANQIPDCDITLARNFGDSVDRTGKTNDKPQREAVIVEAIRTPVGKYLGMLSRWNSVDLLAHAIDGLLKRTNVDPALVELVSCGCVSQAGEQALNIGRNAILSGGQPESIPGVTLDMQCGSSQMAIHFAAQAVISGANDIVIACGVENMSHLALGSSAINPNLLISKPWTIFSVLRSLLNRSIMDMPGSPFNNKGLKSRYPGINFDQIKSADDIAKKYGIPRRKLDEFSMESHFKASYARMRGRFSDEIIPVPIFGGDANDAKKIMADDEGIRDNPDLGRIAALKPLKKCSLITAAHASQVSDGAAAMLIMERSTAERMGLKPLARFVSFHVAANDPVLMLTAPVPATKGVLEKAGISLKDISLIEVNEAFASVVLAWKHEMNLWQSEVKVDPILNVNGGAIAIGHPLGASGARIAATMVHELIRRDGKYALQTMCTGGGQAPAMVIERI